VRRGGGWSKHSDREKHTVFQAWIRSDAMHRNAVPQPRLWGRRWYPPPPDPPSPFLTAGLWFTHRERGIRMGRAVGIEDAAAEVLELVPVGYGPRHPSGHVGPPEAVRGGRGGRRARGTLRAGRKRGTRGQHWGSRRGKANKRELGPNLANNHHLQSHSDHPELLTVSQHPMTSICQTPWVLQNEGWWGGEVLATSSVAFMFCPICFAFVWENFEIY